MIQKQHRNFFDQKHYDMCKHQEMCDGQCTPSSPRPSVGLSYIDQVHCSPTGVDGFPVEEIPNGPGKKLLSQANTLSKIREGPSKQVSFSDLSVREYNLVMGDKSSLATELGWQVHQEYSEPIDRYESTRKPRRSGDDLVLRRKQKKERLKMTGCSETEVFLAKREQQLREREEFFGTCSRILGCRGKPGSG
jgi:hypothetical protein